MLFDTVLAAVLAVLSLAEFSRAPAPGSAARPPEALGYVLVLVLSAPLVARRRHPRGALLVMLVVGTVLCVAGYRQSALGPPLSVGAYTVGVRCDLRRSAPVLAALALFLGVAALSDRDEVTVADLVLAGGSLAAFWWLGAGLRVRAAYARAVEERTGLQLQVHEDRARNAVMEERLRIARELHDVVAHSLTVVAVQSGMARHVVDTDPAAARTALDAISASSRSTLTELRRLLGVLRSEREPVGALTPTPGTADLDALLTHVRRTGLDVTLTVSGGPRELPPGLDLTVYRIVQEALTNVVKHAGTGAVVRVTLGYRTGELAVDVDDRDGAGPPGRGRSLGTGVGLIGMRERVATYGGLLTTGPTPDGFAVRARLPLPEVTP